MDRKPSSRADLSSAGRSAIDTCDALTRVTNIITDEPEWRAQPRGPLPASTGPRVSTTRWRILDDRTREVRAETADDCHVVAIVLRNMDCRFSVSGRTVQDGIASAGMVHVTEPAVPSYCLFRGPAETLHLHVPNSLIAECGRGLMDCEAPALRSELSLTRDLVVGQLGRALLDAEEVGEPLGPLYADSISIAIVSRLLASTRSVIPSERTKAGLPKWRLKRAVDYVEANLAESVSLADIASATGLSRMHFAAQFKAATGLRPHEYLLRRRIERAQEMLVRGARPLVEIALSVGFQSQSHFTTVFKHVVGKPPRAWRQSHGEND
jgi:AraC-like DNA-binding protein